MRIFISYHTPDLEKARAIDGALAARRPGTECYLAPRNNTAGAYWLPGLADEIARSDAVLFLAGSRIGPWQELEYYEALRLSREHAGRPRLVPVVTAGQAPGLPFFAQLHQIFAPEPSAPDSLAAIERALNDAVAPDATPAWTRFQPYKGLPALQEADAAFFFGRDAEAAEILSLIAQRPDQIIALVGQSGVGKSSLARAGVLAALRSQTWPLTTGKWPAGLKDSRAFLPLVVRAGEAPLKELALAFTRLYRTEPSEIEKEARGWVENFTAGSGLGDLLRVTRDSIAEALGAEPPKRFVLYLDQGEELYAAGNADTARRFSALLAEAAGHEAFSVLMSLRSDYYTAYQNDADLFHASDRVDVLPLGQEVLTEIIRKPALTLGATFESDDMAARVAAATERQPGALPLLSDLMHDLWLNMQARGDGVLRWSDNPEIVDVGAPLRKRAEAFLQRPDTDEDVLRRLFTLRLAQVPKTGDPVRRRARRSECTEAEWQLAETLAEQDWRLLSLARAGDDEPTAEVAHERLLRSWPRLTRWLEEERDFLVWRGQIEAATEEQEGDLLSGRRLAVARGWFERRTDDLAPALREFISASIAADDRRIAELQQRLEREEAHARAQKQQRRVLRAVTAGLALAFVFAILAGWQWREAVVQKMEAQAQQKDAQAQRERAQHSLDLATQTANGLVFDVAQKFRDAGVPIAVIADVLARARQLLDQLTANGETSPALRRSQVSALIETVDTLLTTGDTESALTAARDAHDIMQALLTSAPDSADYQRELAVTDEKIGDVLMVQGDLPGALAAYSDGLAITEALVTKDPSNSEWQRDLLVSNNKIGDLLIYRGDLSGALAAYRVSLAIGRALAARDPGNTQSPRDLSVSDNNVGDVLMYQGDLLGALAAYREGLAIRKALAAKDPGNTLWQRDLSVSEDKIGNVLQAQGDLPGALASFRDSLAIRNALVVKDPGNTLWRRDLSVSDEKIGNVLLAQGDLPGALASFRDGLAILKALTAKDPGNTEWQRGLLVSYTKIGDVTSRQNDLAAALDAFEQAEKIALEVKAADPTAATSSGDLERVQARLAEVRQKIAAAGNSK